MIEGEGPLTLRGSLQDISTRRWSGFDSTKRPPSDRVDGPSRMNPLFDEEYVVTQSGSPRIQSVLALDETDIAIADSVRVATDDISSFMFGADELTDDEPPKLLSPSDDSPSGDRSDQALSDYSDSGQLYDMSISKLSRFIQHRRERVAQEVYRGMKSGAKIDGKLPTIESLLTKIRKEAFVMFFSNFGDVLASTVYKDASASGTGENTLGSLVNFNAAGDGIDFNPDLAEKWKSAPHAAQKAALLANVYWAIVEEDNEVYPTRKDRMRARFTRWTKYIRSEDSGKGVLSKVARSAGLGPHITNAAVLQFLLLDFLFEVFIASVNALHFASENHLDEIDRGAFDTMLSNEIMARMTEHAATFADIKKEKSFSKRMMTAVTGGSEIGVTEVLSYMTVASYTMGGTAIVTVSKVLVEGAKALLDRTPNTSLSEGDLEKFARTDVAHVGMRYYVRFLSAMYHPAVSQSGAGRRGDQTAAQAVLAGVVVFVSLFSGIYRI